MKCIAWVAWMALLVVGSIAGCHHESYAGCCGDGESKPAPKTDAESIAQKTCPVMGGAINKEIFVDYDGRRIYFCCKGCPQAFKKDPEKYIKIVDKQLKEAKPEGAAPEGHEGHSH